MELPVANIRKLWAIMFHHEWNNPEPVEVLRKWLPCNIAGRRADVTLWEVEVAGAMHEVRKAESLIAAFGSAAPEQYKYLKGYVKDAKAAEKRLKEAKRDLARAEKLQTIFTELEERICIKV